MVGAARGDFLHELTHLRRRDITIKWLALLACAIHWFNPLVWLTRRELDRACELSCDEIIVSNMDNSDKQGYGNTLIDLATERKHTILSTTMSEKRELKERLTAIMKSRKHTKLAVFVSMIIVLAAGVAACSLGAARNGTEEEPTYYGEAPLEEEHATTPPPSDDTDITPQYSGAIITHEIYDNPEWPDFDIFQLAAHHVYDVAQIVVPLGATIIEGRINELNMLAEYDHILPISVEMWRLDFAIQVEYDPEEVRWGTFFPCEDGWISQDTAFNDAYTVLLFTRSATDELQLRGAIPWWMDFNNSATPWAAEITARTYMESIGMLPPRTFMSDHFFAYFDMGGDTIGRLLLSQPFDENGIWVVERWQQLNNSGTHAVMLATPQSETETMMEYFTARQNETWRLDPYALARHYLDNFFWGGESMEILELASVWSGVRDPMSIEPLANPGVLEETWQRFPTPHWDAHYMAMRAEIIEHLNGLGFENAYQWRMNDGRYALITGWQPFTSLADAQSFFPYLNLPEQIGDFTLVNIHVNHDRLHNSVSIYHSPQPIPAPDVFDGELSTAPMGIFKRHFTPEFHAFYAVYVNSQGEYVGMGVFPPIMVTPSAWIKALEDPGHFWNYATIEENSHITLDMGVYGEVLFAGELIYDAESMQYYLLNQPGMYHVAIYETSPYASWAVMELSFIASPNLPSHYMGWWGSTAAVGGLPAERERLEELVRIFNPSELFATYQWELVPFQ